MKHLALVLSVIILLLATVPCCLADNCQKDPTETEQSDEKDSGQETDCGLCSPFFRCHNCNGFAFIDQPAKSILLFNPEAKSFAAYIQNVYSRFTAAIWQPPKIHSFLLS